MVMVYYSLILLTLWFSYAHAMDETDYFETLAEGTSPYHFDKVTMAADENGIRGVYAKKNLEMGEVVIAVDKESIITDKIAHHSVIGRLIDASQCRLQSAHTHMAAFLLQERDLEEDSDWWFYISTLPTDHSFMPLEFKNEELLFFESALVVEKIIHKHTHMKADYDCLKANLKSWPYTWEDFKWARRSVTSRTFRQSMHGHDLINLVPLADMANHREPPNTAWDFNDDTGQFEIIATEYIEIGEQIYITYGEKGNGELFKGYGFMLENNPYNLCKLLSDGKRIAGAKYYREHGQAPDYFFTTSVSFHVPRPSMHSSDIRQIYSFLRWVVATEDDENDALLRYTGPPEILDVINLDNEIDMLGNLEEVALASLKLFTTTIEQDRQILAGQDRTRVPLSTNAKNAVKLRLNEKEVIYEYLKLAQQVGDFLRDVREHDGEVTWIPDDPEFYPFLYELGVNLDLIIDIPYEPPAVSGYANQVSSGNGNTRTVSGDNFKPPRQGGKGVGGGSPALRQVEAIAEVDDEAFEALMRDDL